MVGEFGDAQVGQAGLAGAEVFAGAARFEVHLRQLEAVGGALHDAQALLGFGQFGVGDQKADGGAIAAPDAPAQLVQLGEAEAVGRFDGHHGRVGQIDADFDDDSGDDHARLAGGEVGHHGLLLFGGHAAVEQADTGREVGERTLGEALELFGGGGGFEFVGLFDQRADDEGLVAGGGLCADALVDLVTFVRLDDAGLDALAAGWEFVDGGVVEFAVDGEGEGARNRGGGHDQQVGRAFAAQGVALEHAEAVLLVDHGETEVVEGDTFFDQGVGADDEVKLAVLHLFADLALAGGGDAAGEQGHADAASERGGDLKVVEGGFALADEEALKGAVVLGGEHFGGGHQNGLAAGFDGGEHCGGGDDGFAGADIALEQASHRFGAGEVVADVSEGVGLRDGQLEGQGAEEVVEELGLHDDAGGVGAAAGFALAAEHGELDGEQFLEGEALAGGFDRFFAFGEVHGAERVALGGEAGLGEDVGGQGFGEQGEVVAHRAPSEATHSAVGQPFGERVDGHEASDVRAVFKRVAFRVVEALPDGGVELEVASALADGTGDGDAQAGLQLLVQVGLVPPPALDGASAVRDGGFGGDAAVAHADELAGFDAPDDGGGLVEEQVGDAADVAEVLVADRQMPEQVVGGLDAEDVESAAGLRGDAAESGGRRGEVVGELAVGRARAAGAGGRCALPRGSVGGCVRRIVGRWRRPALGGAAAVVERLLNQPVPGAALLGGERGVAAGGQTGDELFEPAALRVGGEFALEEVVERFGEGGIGVLVAALALEDGEQRVGAGGRAEAGHCSGLSTPTPTVPGPTCAPITGLPRLMSISRCG